MAKPNVITKQELLAAARHCLAERGMEKTTLKAVAERANVSQGTVFYHFRTKDQLMLELVESLCEDSWQALRQGQAGLDEALRGAKQRCDYDSAYHRLFFLSLAASLHSETNRSRLGSLIRLENGHLAELLASHWEESPMASIPLDHWGILLNALIDGLAVQALLDKQFPKDAVFASLEKLIESISGEGSK
jgi:Transcriptional regulator